MKCSSDQIPPKEYEKLYREVVDTAQPTTTTTTTTVPALKNPDYFCMPAYSIDSTFKVTMDEWARATNDAKDDVTWTIKSDSIKQSDWKKVGHEEGSGGVSIGWLRIGGSAGKDWSDSKVTNESGSFEIQLSAKRAGLFNVTPGTWYDLWKLPLSYLRLTQLLGTSRTSARHIGTPKGLWILSAMPCSPPSCSVSLTSN